MISPTDEWLLGGPGGRQRMIPHPTSGELIPYQRVSTFAQTLEDKGGLDTWKAWCAVKGAARLPEVAAEACRKQRTPRALIDQLHDAGGGNDAANRGRDRHQIVAMALSGHPLPQLPPESQTELECILELIRSLGEVVAVEAATVNDEYQTAGSCDLILKAPDGQPIVADLKTGSTVSHIACAIQLIAHARGWYWSDQRRCGLVAPAAPRLVVIHAPQNGAFPTAIPLDLNQAKQLAALAVQVRAARKQKAGM